VKASKAQIERARVAAVAALEAAYGPQTVNGETMCWEGRIARATAKGEDVIRSGKLSRDGVRAIIADFERQYTAAVATAHKALDDYYNLCKSAGVQYEMLSRPYCPCPTCGERYYWALGEEYRTALLRFHETKGAPDALATLRNVLARADQYNVSINLVMD
jgi:hypothetical protein